ncbi:FAD-binding protein [Rhodococcus sp. ABRD24]|uniref:cholesterol oxidase substrate-binding domain-containing protein n=1 Tax=Rhodococcus sp. ABRD24 TaxID=2507582 RepID=UPI00103DBE7A|nr:cholesterol oxidase substrate-binding domain-containing protein [Rhodococcus sp. ABRD24]QBJ97106.1 FAD-binding protein [Rhodococcus sp. ABRD24]
MTAQDEQLRLSRRGFLAAGAGALAVSAAGAWTPAFAVPAGSSGSLGSLGSSGPVAPLPTPPNFPNGIALFQQAYQNWSKEIMLDATWVCSPKTADDVVRLTNWAHENGYKIRPRGAMHGWTPLTVENGANVDKVILADTMTHLNAVTVHPGSPATVTAGAGASIEAIVTELQKHNLGWANLPAPGVLSIGGALAVNAHGAALPAADEEPVPGHTFGSLSNLVTSLTAVVWDGNKYALKTYQRNDPKITPMLANLGRCFITSVTMQAGPNVRQRCQSFTDIGWRELFGPKGAPGRTFEKFIAESGRAEAIWYPFTDKPWMKVWSNSPTKPDTSNELGSLGSAGSLVGKPPQSREVTGPYNYIFSDNLPEPLTDMIGAINAGNPGIAPLFGPAMYEITKLGLAATNANDIWGWSKDVQFYIKATTLRLTEGGGAVITSRANIATVIHDFAHWFNERIEFYRAKGQFPLNGPVEIRCCGLDQPADVQVPSAGPPTIAATRPRPDHPEWDVAIWLNVLGVPGTPGMFEFYQEMEQWMRTHYNNSDATFRPEWSKGWAFGPNPYTDVDIVTNKMPATYRQGVPVTENWDTARARFNEIDPHRIFTNAFMDQLLP